MSYTSHSPEETISWGRTFGETLHPGTILCLHGDLAAGKTTLIKGIAEGFAGCDRDEVNSPTFVYLNIYQGDRNVYHFDLYRLTKEEEFLRMGFDDYLFTDGICCIEWSEKIANLLPEECLHLELRPEGENKRTIIVSQHEHRSLQTG